MMGIYISETFINRDKRAQFGETEPYETFTDNVGELFRDLQKEYGRCTGRVYIDTTDGGTKAIGWVFEKRVEYDGSPYYDPYGNEGEGTYTHEYYTREVWVTLHEQEPTRTIEYHYHVLH